jgi:O-antigen/teichoic acid export membrane protein
MQAFLQKFTTSRGLQQTAIILAGSIIASGLSAVSLIIITRQLGPARFGEFAVGFAVLLILVRFIDLGMTNVVQRYGAQKLPKDDINRFFSFATKVRLISAACIWIAGFLFYQPLAALLNFSEPHIILLAFFLSPATSFFEHVQSMLLALHRFTQAALINVLQAFAKALGALTLFVTASTITTPIFAWYMIAPAIPLLAFPLYFPSWVKLKISGVFSSERSLAQQMAKHSAIGFIAAGIIENIDVLFVQGYLNTYEAGLLGGVGRVALLFSILAYSLGSVLNPRVAQYKTVHDMALFFKKAWLLMIVVVVAFIAYLPLAPFILLFTVGEQYLPGLSIMNILVAASLLTIAVTPFIATFFSFTKHWYFSAAGVLQLIIVVFGNGIFVPLFGLEAAAWTRLIARLVLLVFTIVVARMAYQELKNNQFDIPSKNE